jgi:hypothetical protein
MKKEPFLVPAAPYHRLRIKGKDVTAETSAPAEYVNYRIFPFKNLLLGKEVLD